MKKVRNSISIFQVLQVKSAHTRSGAIKLKQTAGPDVKIYDKYFEVPDEDRKYL